MLGRKLTPSLMDYEELYNTYTIIEEIEKGVIPVDESIRLRLLQWLFAMVDEERGRWKGGNPFVDLERLADIMKDNIDYAKQFLDEPEKTKSIRENAMIWANLTRIRRELRERLKDPPM